MPQFLYDLLINRGLTDLITVDGLVYGPVVDLLLLFIRYSFLLVLVAVLALVIFGSLWQAFHSL